jgi:hypothetical protein
VLLNRVPDDDKWRQAAAKATHDHEERMRQLAARPDVPGHTRQRAAMERGHAELIASLPYGMPPTDFWPLPGGARAWDDLADRAMLQFPRD